MASAGKALCAMARAIDLILNDINFLLPAAPPAGGARAAHQGWLGA
jgi:hypothetical protein